MHIRVKNKIESDMKKIYQKPTIEFLSMEIEDLIMWSVTDGVNKDYVEYTEDTEGNLGRHNSIWDEEEEMY
jgi:hypothetical protein